jgi:hypothetical protein
MRLKRSAAVVALERPAAVVALMPEEVILL